MNERDYTLATNRANISRALSALNDVTSTGVEEGIACDDLKKIRFLLGCAEQRLFDLMNIDDK